MSMSDASGAAESSELSESREAPGGTIHALDSLFNHITTPGSTYVSPTFLFLVDLTLFFLLFLFISLLLMTRSLHFLALSGITLGLWGSVKLYVSELLKDEEQRALDSQSEAQAATTDVSSDPTPSIPHSPKNKDD